jgi:hypothetical protein
MKLLLYWLSDMFSTMPGAFSGSVLGISLFLTIVHPETSTWTGLIAMISAFFAGYFAWRVARERLLNELRRSFMEHQHNSMNTFRGDTEEQWEAIRNPGGCVK